MQRLWSGTDGVTCPEQTDCHGLQSTSNVPGIATRLGGDNGSVAKAIEPGATAKAGGTPRY